MKPSLRVLIVEDSDDDARLLVHELKRGGREVACERVETAGALEEALRGSAWDIILCDFTMPHFSGEEALRLVQASGLDLPFIYVSGTIGEEVAVRAMKAGAHDYVMKDNLARLAPAVEREVLDAEGRRQHRAAEEAMRISEFKYRHLFENMSDAAFLIEERSGKIVDVNAQAERLLGLSRRQILGTNYARLHAGVDGESAPEDLRHCACKTPGGIETEIVRANGETVPVHACGSSIELHGHSLLLALLRDVTQSKALEEQYRQSQKMEAIGQLASGVAHDFNNVLSVIQLHVDALQAARKIPPDQLENLREIGKAAERAASLTRQLLVLGRREAAHPAEIDLNEIVRNMAQMLQRTLGETIRMQLNCSDSPLFVHADAGMMDQILLNLAVNARDAMPDGGRLTIETSPVTLDEAAAAGDPQARSGSFACLSVRDDGCGIAPENLPRIFEPFFTTKEVGKGTGLGLATVFGIVQQHHGWIRVASEVGRGTAFQVFLPRLARTARTESPAPDLPHQRGRGGGETILLVEDEDSLRALVNEILTSLGYRVLEAPNGVEALGVWRQHRQSIHLLLTDWVMPEGMTGASLARLLLSENPHLKVIYTSGYSSEIADHGLALKKGENFLPKPFKAAALAETVRQCLDQPAT